MINRLVNHLVKCVQRALCRVEKMFLKVFFYVFNIGNKTMFLMFFLNSHIDDFTTMILTFLILPIAIAT